MILMEVIVVKYAFITKIPGAAPENYSAVYETKGSYNLIAGVDGMEAAIEYAKKLAEENFDIIDLSSDFSNETTADIQEIMGENVKVRNAKYTIDELRKLQFVNSFRDFGVIILDKDVKKYHEVIIRSKVRDMRVIFARDLRQARNAGRRMIEKRVDFIELCSWFDILRLESIVEAIGGKVPVGTCGELDITKIEKD